MAKTPKIIIGMEEWIAFPDIGLPAIKAKIDTGAATSALHAYDIEEISPDMVRFKIHPLQKNKKLYKECTAPLVDKRTIISSNGEKEKRFVIKTTMDFGGYREIEAEVTLTSRLKMKYRMLLGQSAMKQAGVLVDPSKSFQTGRRYKPENLYNS